MRGIESSVKKEGLLVSPGSPNQTSIHGKFAMIISDFAECARHS